MKSHPLPLSSTPALTLAGLLMAAVLVLGAGFRLARKEMSVREPVNRQALRDLVEALGTEISRLDTLYSQHLGDLSRETGFSSIEDVVRHCQQVQGIKLHSLLTGPKPEEALHYVIPEAPLLEFTLPIKPLGPNRAGTLAKTVTELAATRIFSAKAADSPRHGWEWTAGSHEAVYWEYKGPRMGVAFTLDVKTIQALTESHIRQWLEPRLQGFRDRREALRIDSPWHTTVAPADTLASDQMPDIAAPLPGRWGHWQVQAWDQYTLRQHLDAPILAAAGISSSFLVLLGLGLARAQRRNLQLAAQRVSFVNSVSHELATPLTNMLLNLDLAREELRHQPDHADARLALVEEEARRLSRLTDNVLTFSRHSRGDLHLRPRNCVPDELVLQVLAQFQPALDRAGIVVRQHLHACQPVLLDADALVQITANLVSNVEKYAASGRRLHLSTHWEANQLTLTVRDEGPGIPAAAAEQIFSPFERLAHHTSEGASGTGLGLAIARDLAQAMGGVLQLTRPVSGAEFVLQIPAPATAPLQKKLAAPLP